MKKNNLWMALPLAELHDYSHFFIYKVSLISTQVSNQNRTIEFRFKNSIYHI